eukprot:g5243.t1
MALFRRRYGKLERQTATRTPVVATGVQEALEQTKDGDEDLPWPSIEITTSDAYASDDERAGEVDVDEVDVDLGAAELWPPAAEHGPGGYCACAEGDTLCGSRYLLAAKLGYGHYATVWKALDQRSHRFVALKVMRSAGEYGDAGRAEAAMLAHVHAEDGGQGAIVRLLHQFDHGPHVVLATELLGPTLLHTALRQTPPRLPLRACRAVAAQLARALVHLHARGVVHTDIKPENVLLRAAPPSASSTALGSKRASGVGAALQATADSLLEMLGEDGDGDGVGGADSDATSGTHPGAGAENDAEDGGAGTGPAGAGSMSSCLIDLGNARRAEECRGSDDVVQSRPYRAPEVLLGLGFGAAADVWSFACVLFELVSGQLLFDVEGAGPGGDDDEHHLAQCIELLGAPPRALLRGARAKRLFDFEGELRCGLHPTPRSAPLARRLVLAGLAEQQAEDAAAFLLPCLRYDPAQRASAADLCTHAQMKKSFREHFQLWQQATRQIGATLEFQASVEAGGVADWCEAALRQPEFSTTFPAAVRRKLIECIKTKDIDAKTMDLIVGKDGVGDLGTLELHDTVQTAKFCLVWRRRVQLRRTLELQQQQRQHQQQQDNGAAGDAGGRRSLTAGADTNFPFREDEEEMAVSYLKSEFEAYDARALVATLVFGVAATILAAALTLDWHSDAPLDSAAAFAENVLFAAALVTTLSSIALSVYGITILDFFRDWASRMNALATFGPVEAANFLLRSKHKVKKARNRTQRAMWQLLASITMLCSLKLAKTIAGLHIISIAGVLLTALGAGALTIRSEMRKFKPASHKLIKGNESLALGRLKEKARFERAKLAVHEEMRAGAPAPARAAAMQRRGRSSTASSTDNPMHGGHTEELVV